MHFVGEDYRRACCLFKTTCWLQHILQKDVRMLVYGTDAWFIGVPQDPALLWSEGHRMGNLCCNQGLRVAEMEIGFHVRVCFNHLQIFATWVFNDCSLWIFMMWSETAAELRACGGDLLSGCRHWKTFTKSGISYTHTHMHTHTHTHARAHTRGIHTTLTRNDWNIRLNLKHLGPGKQTNKQNKQPTFTEKMSVCVVCCVYVELMLCWKDLVCVLPIPKVHSLEISVFYFAGLTDSVMAEAKSPQASHKDLVRFSVAVVHPRVEFLQTTRHYISDLEMEDLPPFPL